MYDKVTVKDRNVSNNFGAGATIRQGTFHMYGGTIQNCKNVGSSNCYGGGVGIYQAGTFIMDGGKITDCEAVTSYSNTSVGWITGVGGGVCVTGGSTFIMNGGTISNNKASAGGGGIAIDICYPEASAVGFAKPQSAVRINGGKITGNEAELGGGIFASGYYYIYSAGLGQYAPGAGTTANPGLYIDGGANKNVEISSNKATEDGGGIYLIYLDSSKFATQFHNAQIKNNTAKNGGGIEVYANFIEADLDGCVFTGNNATQNGGGIALVGNSPSNGTIMKNTAVTGNTSGDRGAGVFYDADSKLTISGANTIQENTFNGKDNNLNIYKKDDTVYPVYVNGALTGSQIGLSDPKLWDDGLEDTDDSAVSEDYLTSGFKANNGDNIPSTFFTSDHLGWIADYSDVDTNEVRLVRRPPDYLEKVTFTKTYKGQDGYDNEGDTLTTQGLLKETVQFSITPYKSFNREGGKTDIPEFTNPYSMTIGEDSLELDLPDFSTVGVGDYWYEVTETAGSTAGVVYDSHKYYLHIVVSHEDIARPDGSGVSQVTLHKTAPNNDGTYINDADDKTTGFTNQYGAGTLSVTKKLSGTFADRNKTFEVTVTLTAPTGKTVTGPITYGAETIEGNWTGSKEIVLSLGNNDSVTFENIPDGVTYTVKEKDYSEDGYDIPVYTFTNGETGDVVNTGTWSETFAQGTISNSADAVTVKNNKDATIDVGVVLENAPFVIIILGVIGLGVFMFVKRRRNIED